MVHVLFLRDEMCGEVRFPKVCNNVARLGAWQDEHFKTRALNIWMFVFDKDVKRAM